MTDQDPQRPYVVPGAFSRGGEKKTVSRTGLFLFPGDEDEVTTVRVDRVLLADPDPQSSAEGWTPILLDTPGSHGPLLPAQDDSLLPLPLPGPMYPDPNSR